MMRRFLTVTCASLMPMAVSAQDIVIETLEIAPLEFESLSTPQTLGDVSSESVVAATVAEGALLRGLDKLTGERVDFELENGYSTFMGPLRVDMAQCRHPADNATGEAYAYLTIIADRGEGDTLFQGWMIASSPALMALDHARYDVWVMRCKTSEAAQDAASTSEAEGSD
ncbi:DUF2155 domain-containing protein [Shimia sp. Alg240-R146]|uniref:DUF2155 domain-containing protein n=1 Tax=Shimia sp. Alg240-R146 TaxID=2993449 RepID=UPI0022E17285|nr:DUF2155 domain-containing protein [Shimia sp. Alg240-R146]